MARKPTLPSYRLHKPSGQAVVTVRSADGTRRDVYLGRYGTPTSHTEYNRVVAEAAVAAVRPVTKVRPDPTVDEMILGFIRHCEGYYRRPDGTPTTELGEFKRTLGVVRRFFGPRRAKEFGPLDLERVRDEMIAAGWSRKVINQRVGRVKRMFAWAVSRELVGVSVYGALMTLKDLRRGRTTARESDPVKPVDPAVVAATLPFLNRHVRAMVELQRYTGMRPGEVCQLRLADIDRTADPWRYRPRQHKTGYRERDRVVLIGPRGRAVIGSFIAGGEPVDPTTPLFSPLGAREERYAIMRADRRSKVQPSQADRRVPNPKRLPAGGYVTHTYAHAVANACDQAFPPPGSLARRECETIANWWARLTPEERAEVKAWRKAHRWHPNQLRHLHATEVRRQYGLEAAQVALGHERADVTQVYAERDLALAARVAAEVG